jgi:MFS family permease
MKFFHNVHKGWFILFLSVLTGLACLGFARFSYGAILPFMKDGLNLNYRETGFVTSSIFFGYVLSAVTVGHFVKRFSAKKVIIFSLWIIVLSMIGTAMSIGFITAYVSSFLIGIGSGGANVATMGIISLWFAPNRRGMALGIVNGGNGLGMIFSGLAVPMIVTSSIGSGWRTSWLLLAILVFIISIFNLFLLKNHPSDVGEGPIGKLDFHPNINNTSQAKVTITQTIYKNPLLWTIGFIYMLWGFSYIIFTTFLVDYFLHIGLQEQLAGRIFAIAGLTSTVSGFVGGAISDRFGRMMTLALVFFLQMLLLVSFSMSSSSGALLLEAILYSVTLWAIPAIVIASISDFVEQKQVSVAIGFLTLFFGTGQLIGPIIIGYIVDFSGSYSMAFILSAFACLTGCFGSIGLHYHLKKNWLASTL